MMGFALGAVTMSCLFLVLFLMCNKGDSGRKACVIAFLAWLAYAAYEGIYIPQWERTIHGAPIRADLLLFIPALLVVSAVAFIHFVRRRPLRKANASLTEESPQRNGPTT
jgi:hypothetical protein